MLQYAHRLRIKCAGNLSTLGMYRRIPILYQHQSDARDISELQLRINRGITVFFSSTSKSMFEIAEDAVAIHLRILQTFALC